MILRNTVKFLASTLLVKEKHNNIAVEKFREFKCRQCPFMDHVDLTCTSCGCLLDVKWKALINRRVSTGELQITHCPKGFWNDSDIAIFYNTN